MRRSNNMSMPLTSCPPWRLLRSLEVESDGQLEVELHGGALVHPLHRVEHLDPPRDEYL